MAVSPNLYLLPAYIVFETSRAIITYAATHAGVKTSPTFITLCSESSKAVFTTIALLRNLRKGNGSLTLRSFLEEINTISSGKSAWDRLKSIAVFAVPSFLYLVNNILYLVAIEFTTPALLHVAILAKLPLTAVIHHIFIRRQANVRAWLALAVLCIGLLVVNVSPDSLLKMFGPPVTQTETKRESVVASFAGVIFGLVIAVVSSFTSIYTEVVLKQDVSFWVAQFWLYLLGSFFGGVAFLSWDGMAKKSENTGKPLVSPALASLAIIVTTSATGLVVANILRKKDNLVKLVGTSASIVTILIGQCFLFPSLRQTTWTVQTVLGAGLISIATWCYHFYKSHQPTTETGDVEEMEQFNPEGDDLDRDSGDSVHKKQNFHQNALSDPMEPTLFRLTASILFIIFVTVATALFGPKHKPL